MLSWRTRTRALWALAQVPAQQAMGFAPPRAMALFSRFAIALVLVTVVLKEIRMILRCRCRFTVSHTYLHTILT
ncbi:MAG: hypothetical protein KME57_06565 [Scytonema hyalinum WJT4-NPBG1]|nr:hypothetical protein [Scytonema hyalinum WJT4-NPBG1]